MNKPNLMQLGAAVLLAGSSLTWAADITVPRVINSDTVWSADNTYILEGYTFVVTPDSATAPTKLTIEAGTVIKGKETTGANAAALIITRGAQIFAEGTSTSPIIFTSELDDLQGGLGIEDTNLWGGIIILGSASINSRADGEIVAAPIEDQIEGLEVSGTEAEYATFGGTNDDDNSGVLRYVSIRHGGAVIGGDNEINGLSLGGVGRGTTIEYIEIFANKDDGIEFFGGTVNVRYAAAAFGTDDSFDYDQGWRGKGQFWFTIGTDIGTDRMDKGGEHDGATAPLDASPLGDTTVYNATYIGIGAAGGANTALNIRDNASARYYNSIFVDFAKMIDIENDNADRMDAIDFKSNVWWSHISENNTATGFNARPSGNVDPTFFWTDVSYNNLIQDPKLLGISRTDDGGLDPRPAADSPAVSMSLQTVPNDGFFVQTDYAGAFAPNRNWLAGWSKLATDGYLSNSNTWFVHPSLGWVYFNGEVNAPNQWIYSSSLGSWVWYYLYNGVYIIGVP